MVEELSQERLDAIRARAETATPGPWQAWRLGETIAYQVEGPRRLCEYDSRSAVFFNGLTRNDAMFIAHARQDISDLLAEIERLQSLLRSMKQRGEDELDD